MMGAPGTRGGINIDLQPRRLHLHRSICRRQPAVPVGLATAPTALICTAVTALHATRTGEEMFWKQAPGIATGMRRGEWTTPAGHVSPELLRPSILAVRPDTRAKECVQAARHGLQPTITTGRILLLRQR